MDYTFIPGPYHFSPSMFNISPVLHHMYTDLPLHFRQTDASAPFAMAPPAHQRERIYVTVVVAQLFWEAGAPMPWCDVNLPHG
jgi:hypothetical protein